MSALRETPVEPVVHALREAPVDPVLPQLGTALDEARMAGVFQRHFNTVDAVDVRACAIERVKYRPGRSCIVAYRLTLRERDGSCSEQRLYAGLYEAADARQRYESARLTPTASNHGWPGATLIGPLNMLVRWFPNDRKLPALGRLADADAMQRAFVEPLARTRFGDAVRITHASQRVVSYFPEHTCTIAVECQLAAAPGAHAHAYPDVAVSFPRSGRWTLYGKTRYDDAGAHTFLVMRALIASSAHARGAVGYARPLAYDPALRLLWQEGIDHPTLSMLLDTAADDALCARVGTAIGALHDTPLVGIDTAASTDWPAVLNEAAAVLARALPPLSTDLRDLHTLLLRGIPPRLSADATMHGDLHANNILAGDARIHFIDLDGIARGNGLTEVCELIGELIERDCVRGEPFELARSRALLHAYCAARGLHLDPTRCAWQVAAALLHARAKRCVTSLKPGRIAALPRLLAAARAILERPSMLEVRS